MLKSVCRYLTLVLRKPVKQIQSVKTNSSVKKPTLPVYHRFYWKRHKLLISPILKIQKMAKTHRNIERMFSTNSIRKNPMVILDFWYLDLGFQDPDPLISVVGLDRPGSGHPKPIWILAYRRFCIFSNFQITEFENILYQIGYEEFIGEFECYIKS